MLCEKNDKKAAKQTIVRHFFGNKPLRNISRF